MTMPQRPPSPLDPYFKPQKHLIVETDDFELCEDDIEEVDLVQPMQSSHGHEASTKSKTSDHGLDAAQASTLNHENRSRNPLDPNESSFPTGGATLAQNTSPNIKVERQDSACGVLSDSAPSKPESANVESGARDHRQTEETSNTHTGDELQLRRPAFTSPPLVSQDSAEHPEDPTECLLRSMREACASEETQNQARHSHNIEKEISALKDELCKFQVLPEQLQVLKRKFEEDDDEVHSGDIRSSKAARLKELEHSVRGEESARIELEQKLAAMSARAKESDKVIKRMDNREKTWVPRIKALEAGRATVEANIAAIRDGPSEDEVSGSKLWATIAHLHEANLDMRVRTSGYEPRLRSLEASDTKLAERVNDLAQNSGPTLTNLAASIESFVESEVNKERDSIIAELEEARNQDQETLESLVDELGAVKTTNDALRGQMETANACILELQKDLEAEKAAWKLLEANLNSYKASTDKKLGHIAEILKQLTGKK